MIVLLSSLVTAIETASVSRILGDKPEDLINQFDVDELNLNHGSYFERSGKSNYENYRAMDAQFADDWGLRQSWSWNNIDDYFYESNELLVIDTYGSVDKEIKAKKALLSSVSPDDVDWKELFSEIYPVFIFDSDYAGLATPGRDTFVNDLTRYSQIFAPSYVDSTEFIKSLICSLGNEKTMGNSYREARNRYQLNVLPSKRERIDISLMSYNFYGNPLAVTTTPTYDKNELLKHCDGYVPDKELVFGVQEYSDSISENILLTFTTFEESGFDFINLSKGGNDFIQGELVLPKVVEEHKLPFNAIIENITYSFEDPVSVNLNVAEYADGFVNRSCLSWSNVSFESDSSYDDKQNVRVYINPIEVIDCESGQFVLYTKVNYNINYELDSPIYFNNINYPSKVLPSESFTIFGDVGYANNFVLDGNLELYEDNILIFQKELNSSITSFNFDLIAPDVEKISTYNLVLINGSVLSSSEFKIETRILDYYLSVPKNISDSAFVDLVINNFGDEDKLVEVVDTFRGEKSESEYLVPPGISAFAYPYYELLQEDVSYPLRFDLSYDDKQRVLTDFLVTNNVPSIFVQPIIYAKEGDLINLDYSVEDIQGDEIEVIISSPFENGIWQSSKGDEGNYSIWINVSDAVSSSLRNVNVIVKKNTPPEFEVIENIEVTGGQFVKIVLIAFDEDGDNLSYSLLGFDSISEMEFNWLTSIDEPGNYEFNASVSDGLDIVYQSFNVTVRVPFCDDISDCTAWTQCSEGIQTRSCTNDCFEEKNETRSCFATNMISDFDDGTTSKIFRNGGGGAYINIPKGARIINATVRVRGSSS